MKNRRRYLFKINGKHTVASLPMERLAQYMAELSKLLGDPEKVHFVQLVESSVGILHEAEEEVALEIRDRIFGVSTGVAEVVQLAAYRGLNKLLKDDESEAGYYESDNVAKILDFPGVRMPKAMELSGIPQAGKIDGVIIGVGGTKDDVPVHVQSGDQLYKRCVAKKPLAKRLGMHLFEGQLRLHGNGRWARDENGIWTLQRFVIHDFEKLDDAPLSEVIADLRAIQGARWAEADDLWKESIAERRGDFH